MKRLGAAALIMLIAASANAQMKTVNDRIAEFGETVRQRLVPFFDAAGISYPPRHVALIGLKQERVLEVHAANADESYRLIRVYPVLAASGHLGPKLREGDLQVPEGIYRLRELNPNSLFHLSLWLDYPNQFDCTRAKEEARNEPGSEIMIHGGAVSKGCLAMGDPAVEDLFVLAALTGIDHVTVILAPVDFRQRSLPDLPAGAPEWSRELYENLRCELARYREK